VKLKSFVW